MVTAIDPRGRAPAQEASEDRYIHTVITYVTHGPSQVRRRVYCVERERAVAIGECAACERCTAFPETPSRAGAQITCVASNARGAGKHGTSDIAEMAARTRVGEVMGGLAVAVERDVPLSTVARILEGQKVSAVPVVTADGLLVGILSATDLLSKPDDARADRAMTSRVHSISDNAPIAHGIALMVSERVHQVPVLSDDGVLVGMLGEVDALAWVARGLGYAVDRGERDGSSTAEPFTSARATLEVRLRSELSVLRGLAAVVLDCARNVVGGAGASLRDLRAAVKQLEACVRVHFAVEEMQLAPLLIDAEESGHDIVDAMHEEHRTRLAALASLADAIGAGAIPPLRLAADATRLADSLITALDHEERGLLQG